MDYLGKARAVIDIELRGVETLRDSLDGTFTRLVEMCLATLQRDGKLVLCGIGKSGHIGQKIAATLASTGSPAAFLHPVEAMHGDLGILTSRDLLLALSFSGETEELLAVLPSAKRFSVPVVAITGKADSTLAQISDLAVIVPVAEEACPFNLAPTSSTTATLVLGDALAMVLMEANQFSREDYGLRHPAGSIGRTVTLRIADVMRGSDRTPMAPPEMSVKDALLAMTRLRSGSVLVVDPQQHLLGIFTDGDFRRHAQVSLDVLRETIGQVMTPNPIRLRADHMAVEILKLLETREIDDIPVVDADNRVQGLVDIQDLPKFKLL